MTPTWEDELLELSENSSEVSDPRCSMPESAWKTPIEVDDHILAHAHSHVGWPTQDLAQYLCPPSIYEAARSADWVSSSWQQPTYYTTSEYVIIDDIDMGAWLGTLDDPLYEDMNFDLALPQPADDSGIQHGNIVTAQEQLTGGSPAANRTRASASSSFTRPKAHETNMSCNAPEPRCPICAGKPFTGQYAQRNLARHMESHKQEKTAGPDGISNHKCRQPGCTSTFRRDDALLVHMRRAHPDLDIPPAKKRKP